MAFTPAMSLLRLLAPHCPQRQTGCKPSSLHPSSSNPVASELMMNTEPAYQENCLCDGTCQPREGMGDKGRLSIWDSEPWAVESFLLGKHTLPQGSRLCRATGRSCIFTMQSLFLSFFHQASMAVAGTFHWHRQFIIFSGDDFDNDVFPIVFLKLHSLLS